MNSPIQPGEYRTKVAFQSRTLTGKDKNGGPIYSWSTQWQGYAAVRPLSAKELFYSAGTTAQTTHRVFIRYRPGVSELGRFQLAENRYLYVAGVTNPEERSVYLDITAIEKTS